jgi:predicted Zn-dependent protease
MVSDFEKPESESAQHSTSSGALFERLIRDRAVLINGSESIMSEKSRRRIMLEQSLAEDPADPFLRYGLAMQCLRDGDIDEGRKGLLALIADRPDDQIAAYQQLGQSYVDSGETAPAVATLRIGIMKAQQVGDFHAAGEMQQILNGVNSQ